MDSFEAAAPELYAVAYRVAFRLSGSDVESADIAQETLARALIRWSSVEHYAEAWVARTSANLAVDEYRRRQRRAPLVPRTNPNPEGERVDLVRALRALPRRQRDAIVLRYLADLDERTVAERMGCSVGAVKQHTHRALLTLRSSKKFSVREGA